MNWSSLLIADLKQSCDHDPHFDYTKAAAVEFKDHFIVLSSLTVAS